MVNDHLEHTLRTSFAEVLHYAASHNVSNRIAALYCWPSIESPTPCGSAEFTPEKW